jgi:hypothetical protein
MSDNRLTALDASFLEVESPTAHMHVGWAALFKPPAGRSVPGFEELREHIQSRLRQAPRYRQKLAQIPFGVNDPVWVDDTDFDVERHVRRAAPTRWSDTVDRSCPRRSVLGDRYGSCGSPTAWTTGGSA